MEETRNADNCFGKQPLRRLGTRWEDKIKMVLTEVSCKSGTWMELAQGHVHCEALVLAMFNLWDLLPELKLVRTQNSTQFCSLML
jgi:hypothetical protein